MKKMIPVILVLLFSISLFSSTFCAGAAFAPDSVIEELKSDVYYVQSMDEQAAFFEKNADKKVPAAVLIKLLVGAVAVEKWGNLDDSVTVTKKNLSLVKYDYGIRTALYKDGEKVSKRELINCLIVYSANDAASIIAYEISGSVDGFIKEMESFLEKAGCTSTVIKNIHGFDEDGQYTTAKDIAKMLKFALTYPAFAEAFSAQSVIAKATSQNEERTYKTSNKMVSSTISDYYHKAVTGGKYTSTEKAGECVAVTTDMDGYSYIAIVLGGKLENIDSDATKENTCFTDAKKMLNWVYENIRYRVVVSSDQSVSSLKVKAGKDTDKLRLIPEKETSALVPATVTPASVMFEMVEGTLPEIVTAPIKAGDIMGQAKVYYAGQELATVNLVAAQDIQRSTVGFIMDKLSTLVGSTPFMILTVLSFLAAAGYLVYILGSFYGIFDKAPEGKTAQGKKRPTHGKAQPGKRPTGTTAQRKSTSASSRNTTKQSPKRPQK